MSSNPEDRGMKAIGDPASRADGSIVAARLRMR
jgi:hypothetical protein